MTLLALDHCWRKCVGEDDPGSQVDCDRAIDLVDRQLGEPSADRHAGVGDKDIDLARLPRQALRLTSPGEVRHDNAGFPKLFGQPLERFSVSR